MGKVDFTPDHKSKDSTSYPKLYLDKGERARIVVIEAPSMRWVHTLRKHAIEDGKAVYETKKTAKGEERQVPKMDFVGQHFCKGDETALNEKGLDPENCVTCRAADQTSAVEAPRRRFAMHVIKYQIQPGSFKVQEPFSVELVAWVFADNRFDALVDFQQEWGDLRKRDLGVGPCEVKQYQKFDIQVLPKCEWLADDDRKKLVADVFKNNQIAGAGGIEQLIGRDISVDLMQQDIDRVLDAYEEAFGRQDGSSEKAGDEAVDLGMDELLGDVLESAATPVTVPLAKDPLPMEGDPWKNTPAGIGGLTPEDMVTHSEAEAPARAKKAAPAEEVPAPKEREGEVDFDDLLDSL